MAVDYRDPTPLSEQEKQSANSLANAIRTKMYGIDVREAIASGIEMSMTNGNEYSLTPSGTFDNITKLKTKYPNGDTGIYITLDDGHWHFYDYNAQVWKDGGAYQTTDFNFSSTDMDGINLLKGTSDKNKTISMIGAGLGSTASNAFADLTFKRGATYHYSFIASELPPVDIQMDVLLIKRSDTGNKTVKEWQKPLVLGLNTLEFNIPTDADFDVVSGHLNFTQQATQKYELTGRCESLMRGDFVYPYSQNPDEVSNGEGIQLLYQAIENTRMLNFIFNNQTGVNLLTNTRSSLTEFTDVTDWGSLSQASPSGYKFISLLPDTQYTYSGKVTNLNGKYYRLTANLYDKNDTALLFVNGTQIADDGRYAISFKTPSNVAYAVLALSFVEKQTDKSTVSFGAEKLVIGNDAEYTKSYTELTIKELEKITAIGGSGVGGTSNISPQVNLLYGTSNKVQTLSASGWGKVTTSSNGLAFTDFEAGKVYTYSVNFAKLPDVLTSLEVTSTTGDISVAQTIRDTGITSVTFKIPENTQAKSISVSIVFAQNETATHELQVSQEKLELGNHQTPYVVAPVGSDDVDKQNKEILDRHFQDEYFKSLGLPVINVWYGDTDIRKVNTDKILPFDIYQDGVKQSLYGSFAWQGDSSLGMPEKNWKFKAYEDPAGNDKHNWRPKRTFYKSNHFNLKAYYTDTTKIRDAAGAEIYNRFLGNNPTAPVELFRSPHMGTIESTPCLVYLAGNFYGVFQMNTKSSGDLWGMDKDNANQIALESSKTSIGATLNSTPTYGVDFELDSDNEINAEAALTKLANTVVGQSNFNKILDAFDVNSIADYFIFNFLIGNRDSWDGKNTIYLTYDNGAHWFLMPYDFNASMLQDWVAGQEFSPRSVFTIANSILTNFLIKATTQLQDRYRYLLAHDVINFAQISNLLDRHYNEIPYRFHKWDEARWTINPSYAEKTTFEDIKGMFYTRKQMLDNLLNINDPDELFTPVSFRWGAVNATTGSVEKDLSYVTTDILSLNGAKSVVFKDLDTKLNNANCTLSILDSSNKLISQKQLVEGTNTIDDANAAKFRLSINFVDQGGTTANQLEWFANNRYSLKLNK